MQVDIGAVGTDARSTGNTVVAAAVAAIHLWHNFPNVIFDGY
jgi:hypothetical protein